MTDCMEWIMDRAKLASVVVAVFGVAVLAVLG
jgi:hypothetical protein